MIAEKQVPCIRFDNRGRVRPNAWTLGWTKPGEMVSLIDQNYYYFRWFVDILYEIGLPCDIYGSTDNLVAKSLEWK